MSNKQSDQEEFYNQQSKDLRDKYQKAQQSGGSQEESNPERDRAQNILYIVLIVYAIILIIFVLLLYQLSTFRFWCYGILESINNQGDYLGAFLIGMVGFWFVLTGFNVILYDIMAGFLIHPFYLALFTVSLAKFLAKYVGFLCGRYKFKDFIYTAMNENVYFIACYLATERRPVKVMFLIQLLFIPTIFKTYGCGLFRITHMEYIYPTIVGTVVWAAFWVYVGSKLQTIADTLQTGNTGQFLPSWFSIVMAIIGILIIIYFFKLTQQVYAEIENDASLKELSHILEKEERMDHIIDEERGVLIHHNDDDRL